jgi:hypothetical protein
MRHFPPLLCVYREDVIEAKKDSCQPLTRSEVTPAAMFDPWTDKPGLAAGVAELAAGVVFFPLVFYLLLRLLRSSGPGRSLCRHYMLRNNGVYDICNKLTSSVFAVLACYSGFYVLARCDKSAINERWFILDNYLVFGLSYFLYDCASMYMVFRNGKHGFLVSREWEGRRSGREGEGKRGRRKEAK